ncbi:hypothetical protein EDC04DRAFT_3145978 [Pisolithus marmoratus]|nr:hypothetical protein EDC04DRAFT_3145978 [Pisolithus marmoratus]
MPFAQDTEVMLRLATQGFDLLLTSSLEAAAGVLAAEGHENSPIHLMLLGGCMFLKAALGMEPELMEDSLKCFTLAKQIARKHMKHAKTSTSCHHFQPGIEWEVIQADATVFLGLIRTNSKSHKGYYLRALYELNSAHSKFNKLFKTLYPNGLDVYATPSQPTPVLHTTTNPPSRSVEEFILSGAAFGYGLFTLVLSLLPTKIRNVMGFLGYGHDRQLALKALAVSAASTDMHSVVAGLVLMSYYGVLLLASGYQADQKRIIDQYRGIVREVSQRYPKGPLWILHKAKIQRVTGDPKAAIVTLQEGLQSDQPKSLPQADALLAFELAWTLFQCRQYEESAQAFMDLTKMNNWSDATYHFLAAGCYVSVGKSAKAQSLLDALSEIVDKRSRNFPTEVFIKKKLAFYKKKHARRGGDPKRFAECMKISPAEELAIAWNTHAHADKETALAHIEELTALTPPVDIGTECITSTSSTCQPGKFLDLDTPDELAVRSLILGILHRTLGDFPGARKLLHDALKHYQNADANSWVGGLTHFELAVLDMQEGEWKSAVVSEGDPADGEVVLEVWKRAIKSAKDTLTHAHALCTRETDLSSRLDSRILMLREEIDMKMRQVRIFDM